MHNPSAYTIPTRTIFTLEEAIFTGNSSISHVHTLLQAYAERNNSEQFFRIAKLLNIWSQRLYTDMGKNVVYIKNTPHTKYENNVFTFPFTSFQDFTSATTPYNAYFLMYYIRDCATDIVLLDANIAQQYSQMHAFVADLCTKGCKPFRIIGGQDTTSFWHNVDREDKNQFTQRMQFPSEIALSTLIGPCNIKCRFCEQAYKNFTYREADFDTFKQAVRAIPADSHIKTSLTPFQEPLTTKRFMPYLSFALKERPKANIGFNTNGILLTEKVSQTLIDMQCKYLVISLNMPNKESYLQFCGKDFFDTVQQNISTLHALKAKQNSTYPVTKIQFLNAPPVTGNKDALIQKWSQHANQIFFTNIHAPTKDYFEKNKNKRERERERERDLPHNFRWKQVPRAVAC